jgi:hypothetical protein
MPLGSVSPPQDDESGETEDGSQSVDLEELPVLPNNPGIARKWTPPPKQKTDDKTESTNPFSKYTDIAKKQAEKKKAQRR